MADIFYSITLQYKVLPMHIAIIMDAMAVASHRHLPRTAGHRAGAKAVDVIVAAAVRHGVGTLTLYAFSAANWPTTEC